MAGAWSTVRVKSWVASGRHPVGGGDDDRVRPSGAGGRRAREDARARVEAHARGQRPRLGVGDGRRARRRHREGARSACGERGGVRRGDVRAVGTAAGHVNRPAGLGGGIGRGRFARALIVVRVEVGRVGVDEQLTDRGDLGAARELRLVAADRAGGGLHGPFGRDRRKAHLRSPGDGRAALRVVSM